MGEIERKERSEDPDRDIPIIVDIPSRDDGQELHELTGRIIACIIKVHQTLGPGFLESVYRGALLIELRKHGLRVERERVVVIFYDGHEVGRHRLDIVVEGQVVLELKSTADLSKAHYAQVRSYLKATSLPAGLLINFSGDRADFRRVAPP